MSDSEYESDISTTSLYKYLFHGTKAPENLFDTLPEALIMKIIGYMDHETLYQAALAYPLIRDLACVMDPAWRDIIPRTN